MQKINLNNGAFFVSQNGIDKGEIKKVEKSRKKLTNKKGTGI